MANIAPLKRDMLLADHIVPGVNDLVPDRAQDLVRADAAERSLHDRCGSRAFRSEIDGPGPSMVLRVIEHARRKRPEMPLNSTYERSQDFFGKEPSELAVSALPTLKDHGVRTVLELGCGQGRDTWYFARNGMASPPWTTPKPGSARCEMPWRGSGWTMS